MDDIRLILGDCLEVMKTLPDGCVNAVITDPPYGISYQSARRTDKAARFAVIEGDVQLSLEWIETAYRLMAPHSCLLAFCRWDVQEQFRVTIGNCLEMRSQVIWDRGIHGLGDLDGQYAPCHDVAWFATKGNYAFPQRRPKSVYRVDRVPANNLMHPTQKPLALMRWIVTDLVPSQGTTLDPFMGSGTTGVACIQTGRRFIGVEIDERYFNIAKRRIEEARQQLRLPLEPRREETR